MNLQITSCCGLRDLNGIQEKDTGKLLINFWRMWESRRGAFVLFSDPVDFGNGERLRKYIEDNKLGVVYETLEKTNPNSGRLLKVYIWDIDEKAVGKLVTKLKKEIEEKIERLVSNFKVGDIVRIKDGCYSTEAEYLLADMFTGKAIVSSLNYWCSGYECIELERIDGKKGSGRGGTWLFRKENLDILEVVSGS